MSVQLPKQVIQDDYTAKGKEAVFISQLHSTQTIAVKPAFLVPGSQATEIFLIKVSH